MEDIKTNNMEEEEEEGNTTANKNLEKSFGESWNSDTVVEVEIVENQPVEKHSSPSPNMSLGENFYYKEEDLYLYGFIFHLKVPLINPIPKLGFYIFFWGVDRYFRFYP